MAKILKKIILFIPILVIFTFSISNVKAESTNYYVRCTSQKCSNFGIYDSYYDNYEVSSLNYCTDDKLYIWFKDFGYIRQTITLYDRVNKYYVNLAFDRDYSSDNETIYSQLNFIPSQGSAFYRLDTGQSIGTNPKVFFVSLEDTSNFYTQFNFNQDYFKNLTLGNFYFYGYITSQTSFNTYLQSHIQDFDLVNIKFGDFYVNGVKQDIVNVCSSSDPDEPTPDEPTPDEPTPPDETENLDKIYVPNYKKGQCVEVIDKDTLRVFENEDSSSYSDYFVNSHYLSKQGQVEIDYIKNCSSLEFTSIGYYRNDFPEILFMIGSLSLFSIGFIFILFKRFRKR